MILYSVHFFKKSVEMFEKNNRIVFTMTNQGKFKSMKLIALVILSDKSSEQIKVDYVNLNFIYENNFILMIEQPL